MNRNNPKGQRGGRNRQNRRRGTNGPVGANTHMNNMDCESSETGKSAVSDNFGNNYACTNERQDNDAMNDNANSSERNFSRYHEKNIDVQCNFTQKEQLLKNFNVSGKQNVDMQNNLRSADLSKGINDVRALAAQLENLKQNLDPPYIINDCRKKVVDKINLCTDKHGKKIAQISSQIFGTHGKDKTILEKHLANMKLQNSSFQIFFQQAFCELNELYSLNDVDDVLKKTEEIMSRVEAECKRFGKALPAYSMKNDIEKALQKAQLTVISCDAVYFGNTVIPLLIQNMTNCDGLIAFCEVSDALALSSAKSCAALNDQILGHLVGYEGSKESISSHKATKIIYTTVEKLFSYSLEDSRFSRFSCIIVNDIFCRSIEADILLASLRECLSTRKDLKLILLVSVEQTALNIETYFSKVVGTSCISTENLILPVQVVWKETLCNSEDDFITEAADMCLAIHVLNGDGGILVFLPSSEDAQKASVLTASKLLEYSFKDAQCVHVNGESKKVFEILEQKQNIRTIIFTHDGFESMMFPNVRYVVDSGRIKEICFDPQKKIEVQRTSFISRPRAKVRRNCAGRSTSGVCYRMYSKGNYVKNMACSELPELLTKSPLNSMVKIFQYKPDTAVTVEFIESFSKQVKENALRSLRNLGALKNERLTPLGKDIIKLPFLPKYSMLIILGIQWGFPLEAIVVVSLFLVKGYFFEFQNTEEFKKKVDAAKLNFLVNDSDTLTFLNIYKQWTENGLSRSWCADNFIEFSVLEDVYAKVNEVCDIVYKNMGVKEIDKFSDDFKWNSLQEAIFECFKDNLCVFTGHFLSGYRSLTAQCIVFLHPSNSIPRKENLPQFIVYDRCISKSRNLVIHTTAVPEVFVTEALKSGLLEANRHDLFERKLVPRVIDCVGDMIIKHAFKKEKLRELEEQIKNETKSELIVIEPSVEKGNVTLYALPDSIQKAEEVMRKILQENIERFRNETETLTLELHNGNSVAPVSISWSSGGEISSVTSGAHQNMHNKPRSDLFDHSSGLNPEESTTHSCIHLSWLRRMCKGFGYVGFDRAVFCKARRLGMTTIQVRGCDVDVQVNKKKNNELFVSDLHRETTEFDLKKGIQESLENDVPISFVNVALYPEFEVSADEIQAIEKLLKTQCEDLLKTYVVEVKANKPKKEDIVMTAEVKFRNGSNLAELASELNSMLKIEGVGVKAKPVYYSNLFCSVKVLKALQSRIQTSLKQFEEELRYGEVISSDELFRLEADTHDCITAELKLSAHSKDIITSLRKIVQELLGGVILTSNEVGCIHKLFCHGGHMWLEALENEENVHIIDEYRSKTLRLYGSPKACYRARVRINEFLDSAEKEVVKHTVLTDEKGSRILLKRIIQEYGVDLKNFIYSCGLRSAELDIRKCQLTLRGSPDSVEEAGKKLEELAEVFGSECLTGIQSNQETCPVCLCPALTLTFRLENCGHLYCGSCIKGLLTDVIPAQCCAEGCSKELILEDIRKILDYDAEKIVELQKMSLKDYIAKHRNFMYCPSPDCTMFVDKKKFTGTKWNCPLCHNDICIPCNTIYHHGFSCDMYQGSKRDQDYSFKVWKKGANCKICPCCGSAIEKQDGCNHMACTICKGHFCWLCETAYNTSKEVYNHMPYCPRNQGR